MRGVVSLAAALSIPLVMGEGQAFPYRNLILFITFIVILVTLVLQGLTLPWVIRKVNLEERFNPIPEQKQEIIIQKKIAQYSLQYLEEKYGGNWPQNEYLSNLSSRLKIDLNTFSQELEKTDNTNESSLKNYQQVYLELLEHQRKLLDKMNHHAEFDEELIRKYLSLIDIEEFKLRSKFLQEENVD
jgi:CPA1 family monovalent cation:H+ antiporter